MDQAERHRAWYFWNLLPDEADETVTMLGNCDRTFFAEEIDDYRAYRRYHEERRAREAAILPDGVAE